MWESLVLYMGCGAVAGLAAGLFGIGGGIVIVPFLAWLLPAQGFPEPLVMLAAVATSLSTVVGTSVSSVIAHHRRGAVWWPTVGALAPGIVAGSILGPMVAHHLPVPVFKCLFGAFLWWVAFRTLGHAQRDAVPGHQPSSIAFAGFGTLIGLSSSVLGIGGGTLSVPYLLRSGYPMTRAIAVAGACGFPIAVVGTATYLILGWQHGAMPGPNWGYVYIPAFLGIVLASVPCAALGARLAHRLPTRLLKRAFALVLIGVGARLLWQGVGPLGASLWHWTQSLISQ
jgi:uncharacterized membrane protein YfcA